MRMKMLGPLLALGVAMMWAGMAGGQMAGRGGTGGPTVTTAAASVGGPLSGQAAAGRATVVPAQVGGPVVGGPVRAGGGAVGGAATQAAASEAEKAIEKYIKDKGGAGLTGRVEEVGNAELKALFGGYTFVLVTMPQWPIARMPQPPLATDNVFAVDGKGAVTQMTKGEELQKFFVDKLPALKGEDPLKAATAWATLRVEFFQDGMFKFSVGKPEVLPTGGRGTAVRVVTTADPQGGNSGEVTSTLSLDPAGKLMTATDKSTLKAGMRPICQATKLLDADPLVRRMAEQDLLVMGRSCFWYLEMMREGASPELRGAIDGIKERIMRDERIEPREE